MKVNHISSRWLGGILAIMPFLLGGFFEWTSCLLSILLLILLVRKLRQSKMLRVSLSLSGAAMAALPLCYLLTALWAHDRGMALPGFFKFLPMGLFVLLFLQEEPEQRDAALEVLPWSGAVMMLLCLPLSYLPAMDGHLLVAGRQAGLFEYPNTYALFLLLGVIVLATGTQRNWYHLALAAVLLAGIFLSGSRAVFVLLVLTAIAIAIFVKERSVRLTTLILLPAGIMAAVAYVLVSGKAGSIGRFLTTSLHSSTLLGRLLYAQDALPVILRHPFGLGYRSYTYMQGSFQTGVYSVQTVHNDFLQLMLDAGWVPALLIAAAVVRSLFRRGNTLRRRLLQAVICLHGLFDFSLQYLSILLIFAAVLDYDNCREFKIKRADQRFLTAVAAVLTAASLYFGTVTILYYVGSYSKAAALDPYYTDALVALAIRQGDTAAADDYAQRVLELNRYVAPAYRIRAMAAYSQGDMANMIQYQKSAIACAPYDKMLYTDYLQMLETGETLYTQAGDTQSAAVCREQINAVPGMMEAALQNTSRLGWLIDDKPDLTLP